MSLLNMVSAPAMATNFFAVAVNTVPIGSFLSASGLSYAIEYETYKEGGRNTGPLLFASGRTVQTLTMEKGFIVQDFFYNLMDMAAQGKHFPLDVSVQLRTPQGVPLYEWYTEGARLVRLEGPHMHAMNGEVAVIRVEINHTGMLMRLPSLTTMAHSVMGV